MSQILRFSTFSSSKYATLSTVVYLGSSPIMSGESSECLFLEKQEIPSRVLHYIDYQLTWFSCKVVSLCQRCYKRGAVILGPSLLTFFIIAGKLIKK